VDLFRMTQQVKRQAEERIALMQEQAARAAAEEANRRLAFLAKAGNVLGRSLDYGATARDVARLVVPALADLSVVTLADPATGAQTTVLCRAGAGRDAEPVDASGPSDVPPVLVPMIKAVLGGELKEYLAPGAPGTSAELVTALVLPLQARGRSIGALALGVVASGRRFGPTELTMAEAITSRAAIALDNALLYNDVQQADRQKNEFLSMLAHELRNPLAPIRNAVQIMRMHTRDHAELQWSQDVIDRQVKQLVRLVDDLLDVSRITQGKIRLQLEPVPVEAVVAQAVETSRPLIDSRRHHFFVSLPPEPLWVNADAVRLAQVLTNLLNNAAKYTDEGGNIWLTARRDGNEVALSVRDTGVGIPPAMLASIFELFTQVDRSLDRSQGGLGIGLTLVRHLVQMHGGTVQASSAGPNQGSEFTARLPLLVEVDRQPAADGPAVATPAVGSRCRVLVVDDNRDAAVSLAMLLSLEGFETLSVYDGEAALESLNSFSPHVVLLDIGLPGVDGFEVARRLRQLPNFERVFLVAVTGYGQEEDRRRSYEAGFDHFLVKPVDPHALTALLAARGVTDAERTALISY
jgi:signal transduction histidine kinase/ActR/RegA family two-component response regulator